MKTTVCKGCGSILNATDSRGTPSCIICHGLEPESGVPVEVEFPDTVKCSVCGKERKVSEILWDYVSVPFFNADDGTYYDGCRGWD